MSAFLSDEWLADAAAALSVAPVADHEVDAVVQYAVSGAPEGKVQAHLIVRSGRVETIAAGRHPEPDCTVTLAYAEAVALFRGDTNPDVAFMSGSAKVEGDHRVWLLDLRPARADEKISAAIASLRDATST